MSKYAQRTRVVINGADVSGFVIKANLPRNPGEIEQVQLTMAVSKLSVDDAGVLVIQIDADE